MSVGSGAMVEAAGPVFDADAATKRRREIRRANRRVLLFQLLILLLVLGAWEGLTRIPWFVNNTIFDPFFISRPSSVAVKLFDWVVTGWIFPHLWSTLSATFLGLFVGAGSGFVVGLVLSTNRLLARIFNPFIVALNSMPRTAFVPLITMLFGLGILSKVVTSWFVVFFLLFFNTYKGSLSVQPELIEFCRTLGATPRQILMRVRVPFAAAWTFAALPNAVSFALVGVVLAELIGTSTGVGYIMVTALAALNATDMFAAVTLLSLVGLALVSIVRMVEQRVLHWSPEFRNDA